MIVKRRNKAGQLRYQVRVPSPDGGKKTIGTFPELGSVSKQTGARWAEHQALAQGDPQAGPTIREFYERWEQQDFPRVNGRALKSGGHLRYRTRLKSFIDKYGARPVAGFPRDLAFDFAISHRGSVQHVRALFFHALDLGLIQTNPFQGLQLPQGDGRRGKMPLTERQLEDLADSALRVKFYSPAYGQMLRACIVFTAYTGLRIGEVCGLRWEDIDGARLHVRRSVQPDGSITTPKNGREREVILPPPARAVLSSFPRNLQGWVFTGVRGNMQRSNPLRKRFNRVCVEAGLELVFHELRHFCGHHLYVRLGLPARVVAVQLGHTDGGSLVEGLYGHGEVGALEELEKAWAVGQ